MLCETSLQQTLTHPYSRNEPSVIVMDIVMPDMGRIEIVEWLSSQDYNVPVILVSNYGGKNLTMTRHIASSRKITIAGTLTKPFAIEYLEGLLHRFLDADKA